MTCTSLNMTGTVVVLDEDHDCGFLADPTEPVEVITESDVHPSEHEGVADFLPREDEDHLYDPDNPFGH